jgi:DNA processing protein
VTREELSAWLRLALTPGVGDATSRKLLAAFGLPCAVFEQSKLALEQVVNSTQATVLLREPEGLAALIEQTIEWLAGSDTKGAYRRIVTLGDAMYPRPLLEIPDPPLMLYVVGAAQFDLTQLSRSMAMVGSRNPTPQGSANARAFAKAFGEARVTVVSGLALGIDGAAHEGALEAASDDAFLSTVAVVGTGLDRVYPARHRDLAHRIASRGLIVSEFPLGTPPLTQNFPKRNRIIAALTRGTLVVEAAVRSGSLITARLAAEQGREVFAIPGSIHAPQSRGCHALIRQGAKLVETVHDVFEEIDLGHDHRDLATPGDPDREGADHSEDGSLLRDLGFDPVSLDALCARTGDSAAALQVKLLELELQGTVARLPGGLFLRVTAC